MKFTIITPSFNQLDYLRRCVASVADQATEGMAYGAERLEVHHHVQDACSTDGTVEFLKEHQQAVSSALLAISQDEAETPNTPASKATDNFRQEIVTNGNGSHPTPNAYSFSFSSERDNGMYEALNKGVAFVGIGHQASGIRNESGTGHGVSGIGNADEENTQRPTPNAQRLRDDSIIAWLNCDEQYLPGTLQKVADFFEANPDVDILFGGMLMVDEKGELLSCRKAMPMRRLFLEASYLYNYSCAMFFRRSLWKRLGGFDTSFRNAGDEELVRRALAAGAKTAGLDEYLATFTYGEDNLSSDPAAVQEHERLKRSSSLFARTFKLPLNLLRLCEKALRGGMSQLGPVEYAIYGSDPIARIRFSADHPGCKWPDETRPYLTSHRLK